MALKKFIRVTLTDGTVKEVDLARNIKLGLEAHPPALGFNTPASDSFFFNIAHQVATLGMLDENISDTYMKVIPPSQIKLVEVIFEQPSLIVTP
jgi:hypothetical protein